MAADPFDGEIARRSARWYMPLSLGAGLSFYLAASQAGAYNLVARLGGAVWVTILSFIVSMPLVTARLKARVRGRG